MIHCQPMGASCPTLGSKSDDALLANMPIEPQKTQAQKWQVLISKAGNRVGGPGGKPRKVDCFHHVINERGSSALPEGDEKLARAW